MPNEMKDRKGKQIYKMMRKNKFVNPSQKGSDRQETVQSPNIKDRSHPLIQNKIYFPASYQDGLMPYKIQPSQQNNNINFNQLRSNQLYDIKQRARSKEGRMSFGRGNKFEKVGQREKSESGIKQRNKLIKYNTIELKNLPGVSYTMSGATIYRSKNIKSSGKLLLDRSISKRGKSEVKRNVSLKLRNEQSFESGIPKSKSNKQTHIKQTDRNFMLYQTYFSSKSGLNLRSNSCRPFQDGDFIPEDKEEIVETAENVLLAKVIQSELYPCSNEFQQQFF